MARIQGGSDPKSNVLDPRRLFFNKQGSAEVGGVGPPLRILILSMARIVIISYWILAA